MYNEGTPKKMTPNDAWHAFRGWASSHLAYMEGENMVTYTDLGFELKGPNDIFQIDLKNKIQVLYWAIQLKSVFVADIAVLDISNSHRNMLEYSMGKKFHNRRGPIILVLRRA